MLLFVSGASCAGKSTARLAVRGALAAEVECVELTDVAPAPAAPDLVWRHRAVEAVVRHALAHQGSGRHLLLASDPVPAGELLAAPSADRLDGIAGCLLDVRPEAQVPRLAARCDPAADRPNLVAFAERLRWHTRDPRHRPDVITAGGWERMRWDRWSGWRAGDPRWSFAEIDTTELPPAGVAERLLAWAGRALAREGAAVLDGRWWQAAPR